MQEKGKIQVLTSYLQESLSKFFLALRVAQIKEAKGFFSDELHTRSCTWKPLNSARAGLSPQEGDVRRRKEDDQGRWSVASRRGREKVQEKVRNQKARRWLREGKVPCVLNQEFLFWFTSTWVLRDPSCLNIGSYET